VRVPRSKLSPPPAPAEHVERGAEWLAEALRRRLTVVVAGPGFGKSTLLGGWASAVRGAWYTAGPADASVTRLAQGLSEALSLDVPAGEAEPEETAAQLVEALEEASGEELLLVVDDAHELGESGASVQLLHALVHQVPPFLHLAVGSRTELPFSVERLRGQGQVLSIDAAQLRFSPAEVAELVASCVGWPPSSAARRSRARASPAAPCSRTSPRRC
jgi:ATP/maltotriose-dependent transcriptional regulator MalT